MSRARARTTRTLDATDGELLLHTGVTGRAAKLGHRLTIAMRQWRATTDWVDDEPVAAELTVDVESLEVLRGDGGVAPLSGPEKTLARSNALRVLGSGRFPQISFTADEIEPTADGYRLGGPLAICGRTHRHAIDLNTEDAGKSWRLSVDTTVRQSDFGLKPYSLMLGSVKVADEVALSFAAVMAKGGPRQ